MSKFPIDLSIVTLHDAWWQARKSPASVTLAGVLNLVREEGYADESLALAAARQGFVHRELHACRDRLSQEYSCATERIRFSVDFSAVGPSYEAWVEVTGRGDAVQVFTTQSLRDCREATRKHIYLKRLNEQHKPVPSIEFSKSPAFAEPTAF